jgi:hypothetical protein
MGASDVSSRMMEQQNTTCMHLARTQNTFGQHTEHM